MRIRIDLPHALFVCAIAGWTIWYFLDACAASGDIQNLGLIAPVALAVVVLCAFDLRATVGETTIGRDPLPRSFAGRILGAMVLLGIYVLTMDHVGFDLATWAYVLANLVFLGERRIWILLAVPLLFTAFAIYAFATILRTPIPLLVGFSG